jgi:hypothetical protein
LCQQNINMKNKEIREDSAGIWQPNFRCLKDY